VKATTKIKSTTKNVLTDIDDNGEDSAMDVVDEQDVYGDDLVFSAQKGGPVVPAKKKTASETYTKVSYLTLAINNFKHVNCSFLNWNTF
jgi:hypothetical protein